MLEDHLCWRVCLGSKNMKELLARPVYCFLEEIWSQAWEELGRSDGGPHILSTCPSCLPCALKGECHRWRDSVKRWEEGGLWSPADLGSAQALPWPAVLRQEPCPSELIPSTDLTAVPRGKVCVCSLMHTRLLKNTFKFISRKPFLTPSPPSTGHPSPRTFLTHSVVTVSVSSPPH